MVADGFELLISSEAGLNERSSLSFSAYSAGSRGKLDWRVLAENVER
jgi:hypothetical protein